MLEKLNEAKNYLQTRCKEFPSTVIVLGSGMSGVLSDIDCEEEIAFHEIPHVPRVGVQGHAGKLRIGSAGGVRVAVSHGRLHYYEGHDIQTVVFPFRAMAMAGANTFLLTNAAGGVHPAMQPKSLLLIRDHINLMGTNPLFGPNLAELGPRFPDLTHLYDPGLRKLFKQSAASLGMELPEGVYLGIHGPSYETPTEIKMYRQMGADVVGMSTIPEAIALGHMGKKVLALSCITNLAAGVTTQPLNHDEVLENAKQAHSSLERLLRKSLEALADA